jgi:hypothetical protein
MDDVSTMDGRNEIKSTKKAYTRIVSWQLRPYPSMVQLCPYKSVVLGCDGDGIGEAFRRYPV